MQVTGEGGQNSGMSVFRQLREREITGRFISALSDGSTRMLITRWTEQLLCKTEPPPALAVLVQPQQ